LSDVNMPVSVVIPTYNRAAIVTHAIDSVLAQTYPHFEIIVVDDGSTDNTREVLNERYGDRVRLVHQSNMGVSAARNAGVAAARYDLVAFLDSDDYWLPRKLEVQVPLMADEAVVLSFTNWWRGKDSSGQDYFSKIGLSFESEPSVIDCPLRIMARRRGTGVHLSVVLCRKSAIRRVGGFDERMKIYEDTRILWRLSLEGKFAVTSVPLAVWVDVDTNQESRLSRPGDYLYRREAAKRTFEVFVETYARAGDFPADVQKAIRGFITYSLANQSKYYALDRRYRMARRRALECLAFFPKGESLLKAITGLFFPWAFHMLVRAPKDREES
jgi:glycosyltransferase involved in cell wall biosynthesis